MMSNRCSHFDKECVVDSSSKSGRYSECVCSTKRCDISDLVSEIDWNKLVQAADRIEREKAKVRSEIAQMSSFFACLSRLEKQKKLLPARAGEFLRSNIQTVEELDASKGIMPFASSSSSSKNPQSPSLISCCPTSCSEYSLE